MVSIDVLEIGFDVELPGQESKPRHKPMIVATDGNPSPPLYGDAGSAVPLVANNDTGLLGWQLGFSTTASTGAMPASCPASTQPARYESVPAADMPVMNTRLGSMFSAATT